MKLSIYQKLFLNRSTRFIVVTSTLALWVTVNLLAFAYVYWSNQSARQKQAQVKHKSVEQTLVKVFESNARYGDLINSIGTTLELGKAFNLIDFNICKNGASTPPKPFGNGCKAKHIEHYLNLNGTTYGLLFTWNNKLEFETNRIFQILAWTSFASLLLIGFILTLFLWVLKNKLFFISQEISNISSISDLTQFKMEIEELKPITTSIRKLFMVTEHYSQEIAALKLETYRVELASQVAHDIRSPLAALSMATSQLKEIPKAQSELIKSAAARIQNIANDLLTKKVTSHEPTHPSNQSSDSVGCKEIDALVRKIVNEKLTLAAETCTISFENFIGADQRRIHAEEVLLERIISNLLNNSIEALSSNGGHIYISTKSDAHAVCICIRDNGKGIPKDLLPTLWLKGTSFGKNGKSSGFGLGLYHCKKIVEQWGGSCQLYSEENEGTEIKLFLSLLNV